MFSNRMAFAAVSLACVVAAAGASYVATRQNQASSALAAQASTPANAASQSPATTVPMAPVTEPAAAPATDTQPANSPASSSATAQTPAKEAAVVRSSDNAPASKNKKPETVIARNTPAAPVRPAASAQSPLPLPQPTPDAALAPAPAAPPDMPSRGDDVRPADLPRPSEPPPAPEKTFDELVVSADRVIGLQIETALSSERAKVEDRVEARVVRDVSVGSHVAIPAGARAIGTVTVVERGGKMKDRARLGIRFNTLVLPDGTRVPVTTEAIYRYGDPPATAQKVGGGAVIGTILGGILGGAKGAAVGAAAGAGGGAAVAASGDRNAAEFPAGMQMTARFLAPVTVTVER